jgi:hypothetical protein
MKSAWTSIGLGLLAVVAVFVGITAIFLGPIIFFLLDPFSNSEPPPIVAGKVHTGAGDDLNTFFRQKFPVGTDEAIVRAALLQQGFKPPEAGHLACRPRDGKITFPCPAYDLSRTLEYAWGHFPCGNQVVVWWTASEQGAITDIGGYHHFACV